MPNCPRCLKFFSSQRGVTYHLSQPRSACHDNNYVFDLEVPATVEDLDLMDISLRMHSPSPGPLDLDPPHEPPADLAVNEADNWIEDALQFPEAPADLAANEADDRIEGAPPFPEARNSHPWVTDYFEGASTTYGVGETFLSQFDKDQYSERRRSNLYYPFASSKDWEEANFLSKSRLSMALVDEYLTMDVVRGLNI